ncbi:MAG TPA: nitrilase-related carbon-nitrogen hydrolase, partial [Pyrinomonadaceae bacterium]|nr:nitrilase-related carbon-nitrogen hydrolase [Pyrinomonadaceae bacterium]
MSKIKIACVQMDCRLGETAANRQRIIEQTRAAVRVGAELVIFPECALTGYCFDSLAEAAQVAEPLAGPSAKIISEVCAE